MPWFETGDPLDPWRWERDTEPQTEALPVAPALPRRVPGATPLPPADLPLTAPTPLVAEINPDPSPERPKRYETGDVSPPTEETPVGPIETKVSAATVATALSGVGVWALQRYVFQGDVPVEVSTAVQILVPALFAFLGGWVARHTPRPDLQVDPVDVAAAGAHALDGEPRPGQAEELPARRLFDPDRDRG